jgi:hypothetical protein
MWYTSAKIKKRAQTDLIIVQERCCQNKTGYFSCRICAGSGNADIRQKSTYILP